ncbi:MAG TPA: hypothetical protein VK528_01160 [Flavobacterium sp.]|nr:hypothetical protein [Flavobacterium sp.]
MKKWKLFAIAAAVFIVGCSKDDEASGDSGTVPAAAELISPINNSECTTGTSVSTTDSKVTFQWNAAANAASYFLYIRNLTTQTELQYNPGTQTSFEVTLQKGKPYSWYIATKGIAGGTANSAKWKFYNSGDGVTNYAPFPAEAVAPAVSSSIYGPTVNLQWEADDLDNDITEYKVYLDTNTNPITLKATTSQQTLPDVSVTTNTTYYWKVDTKDGSGNISHSPVFQFKVL